MRTPPRIKVSFNLGEALQHLDVSDSAPSVLTPCLHPGRAAAKDLERSSVLFGLVLLHRRLWSSESYSRLTGNRNDSPPPPNFLFGNGFAVLQLPPLEDTEARPSAAHPYPLRQL